MIICAIWGGAFPAIKYLLNWLSPLQLVKLRYILATPFFLTVLLFKDRKSLIEIKNNYKTSLLIAAFFGVIGYNLSLAWGELRIPSGTASLIINLSPIFTLILAVLFLKEPITVRKTVGMIVSFVGLILLIHLGASSNETLDYYLYALITLLAPMSWAIFTVASKNLSKRFDSLTVTGLTIVIGTIPLFFTIGPADRTALQRMPLAAWGSLLFLSYLSTCIGYSVWVWALRRLPSSQVASFVYLIPLFSLILSFFFLGEKISLLTAMGALTLMSGVYIVNRTKTNQ